MNKNWKRKFYMIWVGQAISVITSSILQMALIWHLTLITKSAAILSLASIAGFLPLAILGIFAGALVDRWNRKRTIIIADLFIAAISFILVVYALYAKIPIWLVIVILFIRSIGTSFHTPAISAVTPSIVPEEHLMKCSGYIQSLQTAGYIIGAAIAAIIYPIWDVSYIVMLDVFGAVIASLCILFITIPHVASNEKRAILKEMKEGYQVIKTNNSIFILLWVGFAFSMIFSPINALFPLMSMDYFGGTTTHSSIAEISFALGMIIGGLLLGLIAKKIKSRGKLIIVSLFVMGISILVSGLLPNNWFIIFPAMCLVIGFAAPFYSGPQVALMQEKYEPQYLGRVFGIYGSMSAFAMPLGLIISALLGDIVGVNNWFLISGCLMIILGLITLNIKKIRRI